MVVVKNLALGLLMTGMIAAPSLGGAMSHGHLPSHHAHQELHKAAAENLANTGGYGTGSFGIGSSGYGPAYGFGGGSTAGNALGTTSSIWGTTSSSSNSTAFSTPAPSPSPVEINPAPAQPVASSGSTMGGLTLGGSSGVGQIGGGHTVDAYLNFGTSTYSEASVLTSGNPQAWYQSPAVQGVFNGTPTAAQQAGFIAEVEQTITHAYNSAGLNISLTTDPTQNYAHTLSIVSGASYVANPNAIGITDVGNDGFSFIDKFGQAQNADQLAVAVGNNLAHELMHAFGIAIHPDTTGTHLDAASVTWSILSNPNSTFSSQAAALLADQNFLDGPGKEFTQGALGLSGLEILTKHHPKFCHCPLCNAMRAMKAAEGLAPGSPAAVPEPTTFALWGLAGGIALIYRRRKSA